MDPFSVVIGGALNLIGGILGNKQKNKDAKNAFKMQKIQAEAQGQQLAVQAITESQKRAMTGAMIIGGGVLLIAGILVWGGVRGKGKK